MRSKFVESLLSAPLRSNFVTSVHVCQSADMHYRERDRNAKSVQVAAAGYGPLHSTPLEGRAELLYMREAGRIQQPNPGSAAPRDKFRRKGTWPYTYSTLRGTDGIQHQGRSHSPRQLVVRKPSKYLHQANFLTPAPRTQVISLEVKDGRVASAVQWAPMHAPSRGGAYLLVAVTNAPVHFAH